MVKQLQQRITRPALVAALATALAGCNGANKLAHDPGHALIAPPRTISVHQLAGRLGLRVVRVNSASASLENKANSVVIFADPHGGAFVNGKRLRLSGGAASANGVMFVPISMAAAVHSALKPLPREASTGEPPNARGIVALDPGHGGKDPGAIAANGVFEKDVVLPIALAVRLRLVAAGADVIMTRADDRFIELEQRARIANRARADLFVSIHADSAPNRGARGHTVYVARAASDDSVSAANSIDRHMIAKRIPSRGIRRANYRVLVKSSCPAVLVEVGYLSNGPEARRLASAAHQEAIADAIAAGILDALAD